MNDELKDEARLILYSRSFPLFYKNYFGPVLHKVMPQIGPKFFWNWHLEDYSERLASGMNTSTLASRKLAKTATILAFMAWHKLRSHVNSMPYFEILYGSYMEDTPAHELRFLRKALDQFNHFGSKVGTSKKDYITTDANGNQFNIIVFGMRKAVRSLHPQICIVDDPYKETGITNADVRHITETFFDKITPLALVSTHIAGTRICKIDLFDKIKELSGWDQKSYIIVDKHGKSIWPSLWTAQRLREEREKVGHRTWLTEYLLVLKSEANSYIDMELLGLRIDDDLEPQDDTSPLPEELRERAFTIIGGYDPGKRRHPAHIVIYLIEMVGGKRKLTQLLSRWFEHTRYRDQVDYLRDLIRLWSIELLPFDNTRGELETEMEREDFPEELYPVNMTFLKRKLPIILDNNLEYMTLLPDERQRDSILQVQEDLSCPEDRKLGHGEAFQTNCLAVYAANLIEPEYRESQEEVEKATQ